MRKIKRVIKKLNKENIEYWFTLDRPREKEIFHLLAKNYSTKDIARKLNISEKTGRSCLSVF